jgi:hypothetical protein
MKTIAMILLVIGLIVSLTGGVWFLYEAFDESFLWGLACLLVPIAQLFFLAMHWRVAHKPFGLSVLGALIILLARLLVG